MNKIYFIAAAFLFASCTKDFDADIVGFWTIVKIERVGPGSDANNLPFQEGSFHFQTGGGLIYNHPVNGIYTGTWDIIRKNTGDGVNSALQITAVNFNTQHVISHYYDDIDIRHGQRIRARSDVGNKSFMTHFIH